MSEEGAVLKAVHTEWTDSPKDIRALTVGFDGRVMQASFDDGARGLTVFSADLSQAHEWEFVDAAAKELDSCRRAVPGSERAPAGQFLFV